MSIDDEEETGQEWWTMSREEMRRLKEEEDKADVETVRKILREKGTPFFLLSPSQFDLPSGFCTSRSVHTETDENGSWIFVSRRKVNL